MPNHVFNRLQIKGRKESIDQFLAQMKTKDSDFDFNTIIPMPAELENAASPNSNQCIAYLKLSNPINSVNTPEIKKLSKKRWIKTFDRLLPHILTSIDMRNQIDSTAPPTEEEIKNALVGQTAAELIAKYGYTDWYDWRIAHWDTKWNAYNIHIDTITNEIHFSTAWTAPNKIINAIAQKYPDLEFRHTWAEEDVGTNVGEREYLNGALWGTATYQDHSKAAYDLYFEICEVTAEEVGYVFNPFTNTYEYHDEIFFGYRQSAPRLVKIIKNLNHNKPVFFMRALDNYEEMINQWLEKEPPTQFRTE